MLKTIINFILVKIFNKKPKYNHCGNCVYCHLDISEPPCHTCSIQHGKDETLIGWVWNGKVI